MESSTGFFRIRSSLIAILALVGFSVEVSSSVGFNLGWIPVENQFGLFQVIPLWYWLGFSLILLSMILGFRNRNENLFFFQALLLFVSIWCAPSFFESYPSVWDSYIHYASVDSIIRSGLSGADSMSYVYNYPGFFALTAQYSLLGDTPVLFFLRFYPVFSSALTLLALYLFVRTYVPSLNYRYALVVCVLANVWIQVHFSPQSLVFAAGILVFVFLDKNGLEWFLAAIFTFGFVVVSHPTTTILVLGVIAIREIALRIYRISKRKSHVKTEGPWPVSVFLLIWVFWLMSGAVSYSRLLELQLGGRIAYFFQELPSTAAGIAAQRTSGNLFPIPPLIRTIALGALVGLAVLSILIFLFRRKKLDLRLPGSVLAFFVLPFVIVPLDIALLGGQFYDRGFLYLVLGASLIITIVILGALRGTLRAFLAVGLLIIVGVSMTTAFYQESLYVVGPEAISASDFLNGHIRNDSFVLGGLYPEHVWGDSPTSHFAEISFRSLYPESYHNITIGHQAVSAMVFDRSSELWDRQYGMAYLYNFYVNEAPEHNRVYDNGAYEIYCGGAANR